MSFNSSIAKILVASLVFFMLMVSDIYAGDVIVEGGKLDVSGKLYVDSSGNVGIGTITPSSNLELIGQLRISSTISDKLVLSGTQAGPHTIYLDNSKGLRFWDNVNGELVRITDAGNVGIGAQSPTEKLDVNGNVRATAYYYSSDERLKSNIMSSRGLDIISRLRGVTFDWRANGNHDSGLVAQEVEIVLPHAVKTDKDTGLKYINYGSLTGPLVEAIKDLNAQNINQSIRIKQIEDEIQSLRGEIDEIKNSK